MDLMWFAIGLLVGLTAAVFATRWQVRRSLAKQAALARRAQAAERLAEIGAMTSGLAHEIKNPLSTIGLNAQLLAEGIEELPGEGTELRDARQRLTRRVLTLRREVERLRGILTDFLNYAGELRLDRHEHDVNQLVEELADFVLPQAQRQGVRLRTDLTAGPLSARVDGPQLKQAMLNLMLNALQAMGSASAGSGGAAGGASQELILRTQASGTPTEPSIAIHVIDTGPGIAPEVLPRIFTPYFTTKAGGTGLGLPTTRRIVEAHGGRLDVVTDVGKGTDFVIVLPTTPTSTVGEAAQARAG